MEKLGDFVTISSTYYRRPTTPSAGVSRFFANRVCHKKPLDRTWRIYGKRIYTNMYEKIYTNYIIDNYLATRIEKKNKTNI